MKVAHIIPPAWTASFCLGDYRMALAHWVVDQPMYVKHIQAETAYVILDNGAFEGKRQTPAQLMLAAKRIDADELVLPDVPGDWRATLDLSKSSYKQLYGRRVMFVPHGQTLDEWKTCLDHWMNVPKSGFHVIGISPMRYIEGGYKHTLEMLEFAHEFGAPIHLLGLADAKYFNFHLLDAACELGVRGIDTSYAFALGARGKLLTPSAPKINLGSIHQYTGLSSGTRRLITLNMAILDDWMLQTPATLGVSTAIIRKTSSRWLKYWKEGYESLAVCMAACGLSGEFVEVGGHGVVPYEYGCEHPLAGKVISI